MSATVHTKSDPRLFDVPCEAVGRSLASNVGWLSEVYGKAEVITHVLADGSRKVYPDWPLEGDEYVQLLPDDRVGGLAFFYLEEPMEHRYDERWRSRFNLIVWGDMREVSPSERNIEMAKEQVLRAVRLSRAWVEVEDVYERPSSVWRGFDVSEVDARLMMQPFFALRVMGYFYIDPPCAY